MLPCCYGLLLSETSCCSKTTAYQEKLSQSTQFYAQKNAINQAVLMRISTTELLVNGLILSYIYIYMYIYIYIILKFIEKYGRNYDSFHFTSIDLINLKDLIDAVTNNIYKLNV